MNEELDWMMQALQFKFGYALGLSAWVTALRVVMVFINDKLREFAEGALPADKAWVDRMLNNRGYRLFTFLLNALASVKLPGRISKQGDTVLLNRPPDPPASHPLGRLPLPLLAVAGLAACLCCGSGCGMGGMS